jgi:hypothetical protein
MVVVTATPVLQRQGAIMSKMRFLEFGLLGVVPAVVVGLVFRSWDLFALVCLATGVLVEIGATMAIHGDAEPRSPEASMVMMKANQYGYVAGLELPTDARSWRPALAGIPALCIGLVAVFIIASVR